MAWATYHTKVVVTAGGVNYTLPVDALTVRAVPYSGSGSISVELFDGRRVQRIDGWRHEVELSWRELKTSDHSIVQDAVEALATNGGGSINCDPSGSNDLINVVLDDVGEAIKAVFNGRVRNREGSVKLVSKGVESVPRTWITN